MSEHELTEGDHFVQWGQQIKGARRCAVPECANKAHWLGWSSHGTADCPNVIALCGKCKGKITLWWETNLVRSDSQLLKCSRCKADLASGGKLSDYVRFLPL